MNGLCPISRRLGAGGPVLWTEGLGPARRAQLGRDHLPAEAAAASVTTSMTTVVETPVHRARRRQQPQGGVGRGAQGTATGAVKASKTSPQSVQ